MGAPPFAYPDEAGLPIGGPKSNKYVMLEVHYNNPALKDGKLIKLTCNLRYTIRYNH